MLFFLINSQIRRRIPFFLLFSPAHSRNWGSLSYPTIRQEALFDGLREAFHFWEGVPEIGRFDNPRTVARIIKRGTREENERFAQFRAHYGFRLSLCTPEKGNEKGSVENFAGFVQRHFFTPVPRVKDYDDLNADLGDC